MTPAHPILPFIHQARGAGLKVTDLRLKDRGAILGDGYSADFTDGKIHHITAPNGAGKSSLLACLAGLLKPDSGSIELQKNENENENEKEKDDRKSTLEKAALISWLPPDDDFTMPQCAIDVVLAGRWRFHLGRPTQADQGIAMQCLHALGIGDLHNKASTELSSGQKRRVNLARVIAQDAAIMLLDEPFRGLDATARHSCREVIMALADRGRTIIVADPMPPE